MIMSGFNLKLLFICLVVSLVFFSSRAEAIGFFDPGSMATQVVNGVNATLNKVSTIANKVVKGTLNKLKALVDKFTSRFNKKEETKIPGTKEIKESKIADIYDENSIRPAFQKLFFEYPSDQERIQLQYDDKRREFYDDTIIEAFTAVRELEKNLVAIDKRIATAGTTYTLTGLSPETEYTAKVTAADASGKESEGAPVTFTSNRQVAPSPSPAIILERSVITWFRALQKV